MCGACGEAGAPAGDWARPFTASPAARAAVARALAPLLAPGTRVAARPGGWVVTGATGRVTACAGLTELVSVVRGARRVPAAEVWPQGWYGPDGDLRPPGSPAPDAGLPSPGSSAPVGGPPGGSGALAVPPPDLRTGVEVRVRAAPAVREPGSGTPDAHGTAAAGVLATIPVPHSASTGAVTDAPGVWVVASVAEARAAVVALSSPPHSRRHYLARLTGVAAAWGAPAGVRLVGDRPEQGADLLVRVEWARQAGVFDERPVALRWPLADGILLDLEIRAGLVVHARCGSAGRGVPGGLGGLRGGMGGEDLVKADDGEDPADLVGDGREHDGGTGGEGVVAGGDQQGDAGGVAEGEAAQVDDELPALPQVESGE